MDRKFLELLMHFKDQVSNSVDNMEEELNNPQLVCKDCGATSSDKLSAELSGAKTTLAYLTELLDAYWCTDK